MTIANVRGHQNHPTVTLNCMLCYSISIDFLFFFVSVRGSGGRTVTVNELLQCNLEWIGISRR